MPSELNRLSPDEVQEKLSREEPCKIVDVRTPAEYEEYHIPGSILIPLQELAAGYEGQISLSDEIICICEHGVRSVRAAQFLMDRGFTNVADMEGGMSCWNGPTEP